MGVMPWGRSTIARPSYAKSNKKLSAQRNVVAACGTMPESWSWRGKFWSHPMVRGPLVESRDGTGLAERASELKKAKFQGAVMFMSDDSLSGPYSSHINNKDLEEACHILPVEAHMCCDAESAATNLRSIEGAQLDSITLHIEALRNRNGEFSASDIASLLISMRQLAPHVGLAVLPSFNPDRLVLDLATKGALPDRISVMTAVPGNWDYIPNMEGKIRHLRALLDGTGCIVSAIGGINTHNAAFVARAGAQEVTILDLDAYKGESCAIKCSDVETGKTSLAAVVQKDLMDRWAAAACVECSLNRVLF